MPKKSICVREFEYLTPNKTSRPGCKRLTEEEFSMLRKFVLANREGESSPELMRLCSLRGIGEAIQLRNYVGVIALSDGLQIEVLPKIDISKDSELGDRELFCSMLMELGTNASFKETGRADLSTGNMPLYEVFVGMFLDEAADLVRTGLRSSYVCLEAEGRFVRGKIDFAREARKNPARAGFINLCYDELMLDGPENRLIRSTLEYLRGVSGNATNIRRLSQLLGAFDGVRSSTNVDADLARCVSDRSTRAYSMLIPWCRVFLKGESFSMFKGEDVATAILFPMDRVFEDYVGRRLKRIAMKCDAFRRVRLQVADKWLFERRVRLKPDIFCECECEGGDRAVVLDTKWKRVCKLGDLSIADMHQMYAYGRRYRFENEKNQHVMLLYPWHEGVDSGLAKGWRHTSDDGVQVDVFFVDLAKSAESLDELIDLVSVPSRLES